MLLSTLERFRSTNDPILFNPVNASIARWLVAKGWQPAELAPNWWSELDRGDDYVDGIDGIDGIDGEMNSGTKCPTSGTNFDAREGDFQTKF